MSYYGKQHRLKYDADSERRAASIAHMEELLTGRVKIVGRMASAINEFFASQGWSKYRNRGELHRAIVVFVDEVDLRIFFGRHGNCYISVLPMAAECRKASGTQKWNALRPDLRHRAPSVCAGCNCMAMDASHLPFWEERAAIPDRDPNVFRVEMARKAQAMKVVKLIRDKAKPLKASGDN